MMIRVTRRSVCAALAGFGAGVASPLPGTGEGGGVAMADPAYFVPDEATAHTRTFMQWPVNPAVHRDRLFLDDLQATIADIANAIADFEPVVMLMDSAHMARARAMLSADVSLWPIPTDDLWARDSGPLFVVSPDGALAIRQMNFNGWGNKQVHRNDGQIAARIAAHMGLPLLDNGLVGEPGGVESDGHGTLIAHESSWVNRNRNAGSRAQIEALLLEAYGARHMVWAPGLAGEDITDYHIDSLARFTGPGQVLIQLPARYDGEEMWNDVAHQTHDILSAARDAEGRALDLTVIHDPERARVRHDDFVASYANYYVCNGAVIRAHFGDARRDGEARAALAEAYRGREIVTLNVDALGEIGGGIHCATREQPAV